MRSARNKKLHIKGLVVARCSDYQSDGFRKLQHALVLSFTSFAAAVAALCVRLVQMEFYPPQCENGSNKRIYLHGENSVSSTGQTKWRLGQFQVTLHRNKSKKNDGRIGCVAKSLLILVGFQQNAGVGCRRMHFFRALTGKSILLNNINIWKPSWGDPMKASRAIPK